MSVSFSLLEYIKNIENYYDSDLSPLLKPWYEYHSIETWPCLAKIVKAFYLESNKNQTLVDFKLFIASNRIEFYYDLYYILQKTDKKLKIRETNINESPNTF